MSKKIAVVMFNLGGPDSKAAIKPFLMNFFMDKNIIRLPIPFRCFVAALIARRRSKREAGESYGELGDQSPLLQNSRAQAEALEHVLNSGVSPRRRGSYADSEEIPDQVGDAEYRCFVAMRYWHPMSAQVVREVRDWGADEILIVPLYPQFSTTTTWSSLQAWNKAMVQAGMDIPTSMVCCYHENSGFVEASAELIKAQYEQAVKDGYEAPRVLFSAHGLPESVIKRGDPYQWQCEQSAAAIVKKLNVILKGFSPEESHEKQADPSARALQDDAQSIDWQICYQSRVGPQKWIGPSLDEALKKAADDGKAVIIYPHAFSQEHVETLVELDIEYKEEAEHMGVKGYYRAMTVGAHPVFIEGLAGLVRAHMGRGKIEAEGYECPCPAKFGECCMRNAEMAAFPEPLKKKAA